MCVCVCVCVRVRVYVYVCVCGVQIREYRLGGIRLLLSVRQII